MARSTDLDDRGPIELPALRHPLIRLPSPAKTAAPLLLQMALGPPPPWWQAWLAIALRETFVFSAR
jgi:hypothetical protein